MDSLWDKMINAVREEIPEAETFVDKSQSGRYVIVKVNGKTVGYVNGKRKLRVDSPRLDRKVLIVNPVQIPVAIEFLRGYTEAAT